MGDGFPFSKLLSSQDIVSTPCNVGRTPVCVFAWRPRNDPEPTDPTLCTFLPVGVTMGFRHNLGQPWHVVFSALQYDRLRLPVRQSIYSFPRLGLPVSLGATANQDLDLDLD